MRTREDGGEWLCRVYRDGRKSRGRFKRRVGRSGHDTLALDVTQPPENKTTRTAFDFPFCLPHLPHRTIVPTGPYEALRKAQQRRRGLVRGAAMSVPYYDMSFSAFPPSSEELSRIPNSKMPIA
jgi:hypothetical protein